MSALNVTHTVTFAEACGKARPAASVMPQRARRLILVKVLRIDKDVFHGFKLASAHRSEEAPAPR